MSSNDVEPDGSGPTKWVNAGPRLPVPSSSAGIEAARARREITGADRGQILVLQTQAGRLKSAGPGAATTTARLRAADPGELADPAGAARMREQA